MDVPVDYHVWGTMLKHYQRHMPKLANVMLTICWRYRMICFASSWIRQLYHLAQISIMCCCNWWALTLRTVCLSTEWTIGIWHSWLKHLNCWWKAIKIWFVILHIQCATACLFEKVNFKLLYLRNYISYFNKTRRISCVNTHIKSLKVWLKSILPWLKYSIFSRGLFFIGTPCRNYIYRIRHSFSLLKPRLHLYFTTTNS